MPLLGILLRPYSPSYSSIEKLYLNYRATLRALAAALEAREIETKRHSEREGDQICLGARIFAVADAVDAMTSDRPYRSVLTMSEDRLAGEWSR